MKKAQLIVAGIGPGSPEDITPAVIQAVKNSDVVIGYKYYFQFIEPSGTGHRMYRHRNET